MKRMRENQTRPPTLTAVEQLEECPTVQLEPGNVVSEVQVLIQRAQAGDGAAFGLLYDRYFDTVFRFVYFRVSNRQLAEDLTADTFVRALKRISSFTWQGRDLGAWLVTIARNLISDHFKSSHHRRELVIGDVVGADSSYLEPQVGPETVVIDHLSAAFRNDLLLAAIRQLNENQQECIALRFFHGFSVTETAKALNCTTAAVKALQYRAIKSLGRLLPEGLQL